MKKNVGVCVSIPRLDAVQQVAGKPCYGADVNMEGMLICKIKRSDRASAKILRLDVSKAQALPGVEAVVTHKDLANNIYGVNVFDQPYFASDTVRQYSDALAAVAAVDEKTALKALELIEVDYKDLPIVTNPIEAMEPACYKVQGGESNIIENITITNGDVEKGFAESKYIFEQRITTPGVEHCSIEPHAAIAYIDSSTDELVIRTSMQKPFEMATDISRMLGRPISSVRVFASAIGGGFGGKNEPSLEPSIALLTVKTGKPVKCEYTREDEFNCSTIRHPYIMHYKTGIAENGKILAREVNIISDCGPYVSWGASTLHKASIHACGPYDIPNTRVNGKLVYTNNPVGGAMRGFGVTQLGFAYEVHTTYCAEKINMDPVEFRRINIIHDGSQLPTGMIMNIVTVEDCLNKVIEMAKEGGDW